jgi:DNA-binding LytR/AlgR family response regulator
MTEPVIFLCDTNHVHVIPIQEIVLIKAQRSYCEVFLHNGERNTLTKPLAALSKEISKQQFVKIGKSHLINRKHIRMIDKKNKKMKLSIDHDVHFPMKLSDLLLLLGNAGSEAETACRENG